MNNNLFTNLVVQQNLRDASDACERRPELAADFGVDTSNPTTSRLARWDFDRSVDNYPLLLNYPYYDLYRKQVVKQADLVLAMYLRGDAFTPAQKLRNFDFYEPLTVRIPRVGLLSGGHRGRGGIPGAGI